MLQHEHLKLGKLEEKVSLLDGFRVDVSGSVTEVVAA